MKKYYRNRHSTFLKALVEQKKKKEDEKEYSKKEEEKRRAKLKEKVLGNTQIVSKFKEDPLALMNKEMSVMSTTDNTNFGRPVHNPNISVQRRSSDSSLIGSGITNNIGAT